MNLIDEIKRAYQRNDNTLNQLIITNIIVFVILSLFWAFARNTVAYTLIAEQFSIPPLLGEFIYRPWTIITYAFNHAGFSHILFNMLALYWFGRLIVEYLGHQKLLNLYVLGAVAGATLYLLCYNFIPYFMARASFYSGMVGASAAVYAIAVGAATLLPDYRFYLIFIGPVKIMWIVAVFLFTSLIGITETNAGGNLAHLGGGLIGYLYIVQLRKGSDLGKPVTAVLEFFRGLFKKKSKIKVTYKSERRTQGSPSTRRSKTKSTSSDGNIPQSEIDAILDKISEKGYESLTKEEKQKLFNASK